jgi:hypothetical protein
MRKRLGVGAVVVGATLLTLTTVGVASAAAFVERDRNNFTCGADPDDVPGLPGFGIANSTVVVTPTGALHVTCFGALPTDLSVPSTFVGHVICRGDPGQADAVGDIVVTVSGRVTITCLFPAPG